MNTVADSLFQALSDRTRLRCVALLKARVELCVCELQHALAEPQPKISRHLSSLRKAGIVGIRRNGLWIHYRINSDLPAWAVQVIRTAARGVMDSEPFLGDGRRLSQIKSPQGRRCFPALLSRRRNILFLCTGNSCRSQMAEGWGRFYTGDKFEMRSAGLEPSVVDPRAVEVMRESGIDISFHTSTPLTPALLDWADILIALCKHAYEHCLVTPERTAMEHWNVEDPAAHQGSEPEVMDIFRATRDRIKQQVESLLSTPNGRHQTA